MIILYHIVIWGIILYCYMVVLCYSTVTGSGSMRLKTDARTNQLNYVLLYFVVLYVYTYSVVDFVFSIEYESDILDREQMAYSRASTRRVRGRERGGGRGGAARE